MIRFKFTFWVDPPGRHVTVNVQARSVRRARLKAHDIVVRNHRGAAVRLSSWRYA